MEPSHLRLLNTHTHTHTHPSSFCLSHSGKNPGWLAVSGPQFTHLQNETIGGALTGRDGTGMCFSLARCLVGVWKAGADWL